MKYPKRFLALAAVLAVLLVLKFRVMGVDSSGIGQFRGGTLDAGTWDPLVARSVNSSALYALIDNQQYSSTENALYMDDDRSVMAPVGILRDALNCSARVYDGTRLLVEKHSRTVSLTLGETTAYVDGEETETAQALRQSDGQLFVSLNVLAELLGYSYSFDMASNTVTASDTDTSSVVPASYDLREKDRVSVIYDQGSYGTCWAFAATSALESSLRPEETVQFSVDHMSMSNSYNANQYDGGEYTMGMAYLAAWQGPVYESDDPYGDGETDGTLTAVRHVQEMQIIDGKDYEGIKEAVFRYGGVETSLYSTIRSSQGSSVYYNEDTSAYCYIGTEKPNHDVVIIGWDDNYPASNFNTSIEGDGAFICQNSWGSGFGEDGVFYVSYYDTNIGTHNVAYTRVDEVGNYDRIYQSDLCGWVGSIGFNSERIYGANIFTAESTESVCAASFYATGANTEYEVYIVQDFEDEDSFSKMVSVASGALQKAGYYTIDFDTEITVEKGSRYAVVVYLDTPGSEHPMAIEYDTGESLLAGVDLDDGEGYISLNGKKFTNVKEKKDCNLCIKAFTRNE